VDENTQMFNNGIKYNKWLDVNNKKDFAKTFNDWYNHLQKHYELI
jgi:hypothetical protein